MTTPDPGNQQYPPTPQAPGPGPLAGLGGKAPLTPDQERLWGMLAHGGTLGVTLLSGGTLGFLFALGVYLTFKDRSAFVRSHAANALNVQIIVAIVCIVSLPFIFILIGFIPIAAALLFGLIVHIQGAVKANSGQWYTPPLTPQIVR